MLTPRKRIACLFTSTILAIGSPLVATTAFADEGTDGGRSHDHAENAPEIIVSGRLVSGKADALSAPAVLAGDALTRELRPQIGELLAGLPGVSSTGFAPGVSRPVLRGFDGPRVQILLEGIGALDASSVSADHAVSMDTLTVDRIEVMHGPRVLLYSSNPAGGAVNALDKRIPRKVPDKAFTIDAIGSYGTAADQRIGSMAADLRLSDRIVAHVDASAHRSDDLRIGGNTISPGLRSAALSEADALAEAGETEAASALVDAANRRGTIANSWTKGHTLGAGLAFLDTGGDIGVSVQRISSDYGIPPRPSADAEEASISMRQTRVDMRAGINPAGFFKRIELRGAYGDYWHAEIEDGEIGTSFASKSLEARVQADQARRGAWSGSSGASYASSRLTVRSEEPLMPDNETQRLALFTFQKLEIGAFDVEGAMRYENTRINPISSNAFDRNFNQISTVAGIAWHPAERVTISASYLHGERAPSAEELFVDGEHHASQSYQRGNPNFTVERSNGVEAGIRFNGNAFAGSVTAYATDFDNFITAVPTGEVIHFPVYQYVQAPARFRGIEAEGALTFARFENGGTLKADAGLDYTHARLVDIGPVPRIPPLRARGGLEYGSSDFALRGEVEWYARQDRVSANELPTGAYTLVNLSATWRPFGETGPVSFILAADNLLDVNGRLATSDTRDFVPISGRDIRLTAKFSY